MKILFIVSETLKKKLGRLNKKKPLKNQEEIHYGVSYLSAMLKSKGHETDVFIVTSKTSTNEIFSYIESYQPKLIGFSTVFREFDNIMHVAELVKDKFADIWTVIGGPQVTLKPETAIHRSINAINIGEGEYSILELVTQLETGVHPSGIQNLWIRQKNGEIEKNTVRPFNCNLDRLPFPDRKIWQKYIELPKSMHNIIIGRGCPYLCTYCSNHALKKAAPGQYVRFRSPDNIIEEIRQILSDFPDTEHIFLEAEALNLNMNFLVEFCEKLEAFNRQSGKMIMYGANLRLRKGLDIPLIMNCLFKANIMAVNIGLESGSEEIRKHILSRGEYTNEDVITAAKYARKYRMHLMLFVLLGLPDETNEDFQQTLQVVKECRPSFIHLGIFTPYPGTKLYDYAVQKGYINGERYKEKGRSLAALDMPQFSKRKIQKEYYLFFTKVYAKNLRQKITLLFFSLCSMKLNIPSMQDAAIHYIKRIR